MIGITSFSDYVNWKCQIIIRLTSTSDADPVQMDFLKLRLLAIGQPPPPLPPAAEAVPARPAMGWPQ